MDWEAYYWERVKKIEGSACLVWVGPYSDDDRPIARSHKKFISALGVAWMVDGGWLWDGPFVSTCRTPGCVNVDHIRRKCDYPLGDENAIDERLSDGFKMLGDDEDLSDCD